ncbi:MAG: TetR/AcrR family transcriptional regulator [Cyanobacteria bacterium P01_B01_bin.77]
MPKQAHLPTLLRLFRQFGYEGVTLSKISQETGLKKASLYHHFPGGKAEMAEAALMSVNQWLETSILRQLSDATPQIEAGGLSPIDVFQEMCEETSHFFRQGENACLWAVMVMEQSSHELFHAQINWAFTQWVAAIANVLIAAGLDVTLAKQRGEDAMIAIQGALILSHGLNDFSSFQRVIKQLPSQLCQAAVYEIQEKDC